MSMLKNDSNESYNVTLSFFIELINMQSVQGTAICMLSKNFKGDDDVVFYNSQRKHVSMNIGHYSSY